MREARLDPVARIVRERKRDRARGGDRSMVREPRALLGERVDELGLDLGQSLHVAAVPRVEHLALDPISDGHAVARHLRAPREHLRRHRERLLHQRRRALLPAQAESGLPPGNRHFARHALGEPGRCFRAVLHAQHRQGRAESEIAHPVASLAHDLVALRAEGESVDLDDVVEHAGEHADDFPKGLPVEARVVRERIEHETGEVDRAEQA